MMNTPQSVAGTQRPPGALAYGRDARSNRWFCAFLLAAAVGMVGGAFVLTPSPVGWEAHLRVLSPCLFRVFTGLPCPFCGMTTAFTQMARGDVGAAFKSHVLGPAAYAAAWALLFAALGGLIRGRWPLPEFAMSPRFYRALIAVVVIAWAVNVARALLSA